MNRTHRPADVCRAARPANLWGAVVLGALAFGDPGTAAAQTHPRVTGRIDIGLLDGTLAGSVCLEGLPAGDSLHVLLNSALSIRSVDGAPPAVVADTVEPGGATRLFTLARETGPNGAPWCIEYDGHERVYDVAAGEYREDDTSSLIAFNGGTVRARGAARWLPTPFDTEIGLPAERVAFELEIHCAECATLFVNGGSPVPGPVATFRSAVPTEPYLVAGDVPVTRWEHSWILGDVRFEDAGRLIRRLREISDFYSGYLGVPFGRDPDLVFLDPVRRPRRGQLWGFLSDPALSFLGSGPDELLRSLNDDREQTRDATLGFLAHELAHRYFGWELGAASPQRDLFGEPFAALLELKAVRHFAGDDAYRRALQSMRDDLAAAPELVPLDRAGPDDFDHPTYRYVYVPLLLLALEEEIGEAAMRELMRDLLTAPAATRATGDFAFLLDSATRVAPSSAVDEWRSRCLAPERLITCMP